MRVFGVVLACGASVFGSACGSSSGGDAPGATSNSSDASAPPVVDMRPDAVIKGELYVKRRACGDCHQSTDSRDGVLSGQSTPRPGTQAYPKNLTPDPDTGLDDWTDDQIIRAIRAGQDDEGEDLCGIMPRFKNMGDDEAQAIAAYLKSLPPVHHAIPETTCADDAEDGGP